METNKKEQLPPHNIALLPPPGFIGHLIPFIELAKKLVHNYNFTVTLILVHDGSHMKPQKSLLQGLTPSINPIFLPPVLTDDLPKDIKPELLLPLRVIRSLPAIRDTLALLIDAAALVVDLFAPHAINVAKEFGIPAYIFYTASANDLSLSMDLPMYDESCTSEYKDLPGQIKLPGSIVLRPEDLPDSMIERNTEVHKCIVGLCQKYLSADGIMVNSFLEFESEAFRDLECRFPGIPKVYPVGPLIRRDTERGPDGVYECLKWMSEQPTKSVLFVSFGSGGTLSIEQFHELALGLELSGQRFLWVVRSPQENTAAAYLNPETVHRNPLEFLPEGFLEKTKGRGFVVPSWAPQTELLSHGSMGGFLTHCGWNSLLESAVFGVPLIAWPLCFDHKMNAVIATEGMKVAIRVKENAKGIVERGHIASLVEGLIEGEDGKQLRKRMSAIRNAALEVLGKDGSSTLALDEVVQKWMNGS